MITCVVEYVIDPAKIEQFEQFAQRWIELVNRHGGTHHGYFLPSEGASDKALALFSFPSLAAYEQYRQLFGVDPDFVAADRIRDQSGCVLRYDRFFLRPLLPCPGDGPRACRPRPVREVVPLLDVVVLTIQAVQPVLREVGALVDLVAVLAAGLLVGHLTDLVEPAADLVAVLVDSVGGLVLEVVENTHVARLPSW
jgi:hypothetical protein